MFKRLASYIRPAGDVYGTADVRRSYPRNLQL